MPRGEQTICLNCGATLHGPFCSACGQRAIAAYPTIAQMVGDAWHELSGYDGRFARTFRTLLTSPGALTVDALQGRRARYISPVRLYLVASLAYFLCASAIPNIGPPDPAAMPGSRVSIRMDGSGRATRLTPEDRDEALKNLERAPWWARAVMRPILTDPEEFRLRFLQTLPRALFMLVPVFAAIVALFYRRRRFTQHLIFAVHLHAAVFITLIVRELSQLVGSRGLLGIFESASALAITAYSVMAFRRVYGENWPRVLVKGAGIAVLYCVAGIFALLATMAWATMVA